MRYAVTVSENADWAVNEVRAFSKGAYCGLVQLAACDLEASAPGPSQAEAETWAQHVGHLAPHVTMHAALHAAMSESKTALLAAALRWVRPVTAGLKAAICTSLLPSRVSHARLSAGVVFFMHSCSLRWYTCHLHDPHVHHRPHPVCSA